MSLRVFIGAMRGSLPVTGGAFEKFGGDTTALLLIGSNGERLVLDAGTGMRAVAKQLAQTTPGEVTMLFSHYHLDHIAGLMMNPLFYKRDWSFRLVGPILGEWNIRNVVSRLLAPPYWPVPWERMSAKIEFGDFTAHEMQIGHLRVRGCYVPHPGGCVAYRIDDVGCGASVVFATDIEWRARDAGQEKAFVALCTEPTGADVLIIDAHFDRANADAFVGWGHSCWQDCLAVAELVNVKKVILGHHAPDADDKLLQSREKQIKKQASGAMLARAGQWLTIGG